MPKYWRKQIFTHGRFPEGGQKQETEREKKEKGLSDSNNKGQAMHGARKPPGPKITALYFTYNNLILKIVEYCPIIII